MASLKKRAFGVFVFFLISLSICWFVFDRPRKNPEVGVGVLSFQIPNVQARSGSLGRVAGDVPTGFIPQLPVSEETGTNQLTFKELSSVEQLVRLMALQSSSSRENSKILVSNLLRDLNSLGLLPVVQRDSHPIAGDLIIIRTQNTLVGTRYFHAQFMTDRSAQEYLQHLSFEIRPTKDSFVRAIEMIRKSFGTLKITGQSDQSFDAETSRGYSIWIEPLLKSDLVGHLFNAYSENDVGTIRVVIEKNPHHGHRH